MSLINDALKRASQADKERVRPAGSPPSITMTPAPAKTATFPVWVGVMIAVPAVLAGVIFWPAFAAKRDAVVVKPPAAIPVVAVAPAPAPVVVAIPSAPLTPTPAPAPVPKAPPFPTLKLGGIFFSRTNPHALINGRTVAEGEQIGDVTVKKIEAGQVILEWNGQQKMMQLQGP